MSFRSTLPLVLAFTTLPAIAADHAWPGPAPCNTTLTECILAAAPGDTVRIVTATPIAQTVHINQPVTLEAAPGVKATLATGHSIEVRLLAGAPAGNVTLAGLHLSNGRILFDDARSANTTLRLYRNRIDIAPESEAWAQLYVRSTVTTGVLTLDLRENAVTTNGHAWAGIEVQSQRRVTGAIAYNRVRTRRPSLGASGIRVTLPGAAQTGAMLAVYGNQLDGRTFANAIRVTLDGDSAAPDATSRISVANNAIHCGRRPGYWGNGIAIDTSAAAQSVLRIVNNTVVACQHSISISNEAGDDANLSGTVLNNLTAFNEYSPRRPGRINVGNMSFSHNLVWQNLSGNALPSGATNTVNADPKLYSHPMPRLAFDSPAINAGNGVSAALILAQDQIPATDADGRRRFIGNGVASGDLFVDIGAFEYGDLSQRHTVPAVPASSSLGLGLADRAALPLQLTKATPPGTSLRILSTLGAQFFDQWHALALDDSTLTAGAQVHAFSPGPRGALGTNYRHIPQAGNVDDEITYLDHTFLNGRHFDQAIVLATPNWQYGALSTHLPAVSYACGSGSGARCWTLTHLNAASIPVGEGFGYNIYAQEPSPSAFVVRATPDNIVAQAVRIDHPVLGDDPLRCAAPQATRRYPNVFGAPLHDRPFDLIWQNGQWSIFTAHAPPPPGTEWAVVYDARAFAECSTPLFADGFES